MPSKLPLRPLHDRVFVYRVKAPEKVGLVIIPATVKERNKTLLGKVVAVGAGFRMDNGKIRYAEAKVGDHVLFSQFGKTRLTWNGEELLALRHEHQHAIVDDLDAFGVDIDVPHEIKDEHKPKGARR